MPNCSWCGGDLITVTDGLVDDHKVVEADPTLCPGSGKPPAGGPTWVAVVTDVSGFVLEDEMLRRWAEAVEAGAEGWAVPCEDPDEIVIVTGTARPVPQSDHPDEEILRRPGSYTTEDCFVSIDVSSEDPDVILRLWERARSTAAAMNTAGVL